jgi:hypothetical protein
MSIIHCHDCDKNIDTDYSDFDWKRETCYACATQRYKCEHDEEEE